MRSVKCGREGGGAITACSGKARGSACAEQAAGEQRAHLAEDLLHELDIIDVAVAEKG